MTIQEWGALLLAVLTFPKAMLQLAKVLRDTEQEKHEDLVKRVQDESARLKAGGRPEW